MTVMELSPVLERKDDSSTLCPIDLKGQGLCENKENAEVTDVSYLDDGDGPDSSQTVDSLYKQFDSSLQVKDNLQTDEQGNGDYSHIKQSNIMEVPIQNESNELSTVPPSNNNCLENKTSTLSTVQPIGIDSDSLNKEPRPKRFRKNKSKWTDEFQENGSVGLSEISKSSPPKQKRQSFVKEEELNLVELRKPIAQGYVREVVYRMISTSTNCDIYYRPPQGPKLRSKNDVVKFLQKKTTPFNLEHFCFNRIPLGFGEPFEVVRNANFNCGRNAANSSNYQSNKKFKEEKLSSPKKANCIINHVGTSAKAIAKKEISKIMKKIRLALNKDDDNYHIVKNKENQKSTSLSGNTASKKRCLSNSEALNGTVVIVQEELEECVGKFHTDNKSMQQPGSYKFPNRISSSKKRKLLKNDCNISDATTENKKFTPETSKMKKLISDNVTECRKLPNESYFLEGKELCLKNRNYLSNLIVRKKYYRKLSFSQRSKGLGIGTSAFKAKLACNERAKKICPKAPMLIQSNYSGDSSSNLEAKRPLVPALKHFYDVMDEVKANNPTLKNFEISRIIDCMWRNICFEKKKKYEDDYVQQMHVYMTSVKNERQASLVGKNVCTERSSEKNDKKRISDYSNSKLSESITNTNDAGEDRRIIENHSLRKSSIPVFQMSVDDYSEIGINLNDINEKTQRKPYIENSTSVISKSGKAEFPITSSVPKIPEGSSVNLNLDNKTESAQGKSCIENITFAISKSGKAEFPITSSVPKIPEASSVNLNLDNKTESAQGKSCIENSTATVSTSGKAECLITSNVSKFPKASTVDLNLDNKNESAQRKSFIENITAAISKSGKTECPITSSVPKFPETARIRVRPMEELFSKPLNDKFPAIIIDQATCPNNLNVVSQSQNSVITSSSGIVKSSPIILFAPNSNFQNVIPSVHSSFEAATISSTCHAPVWPVSTLTVSGPNQVQNQLTSCFSLDQNKPNNIGKIQSTPFLMLNSSKTNQNQQCLTYVTNSTSNDQSLQNRSFASFSYSPINILRNVRFQPDITTSPTANSSNLGKQDFSSQTSISDFIGNNKNNSINNLSPNELSNCTSYNLQNTSSLQPTNNCLVSNQTLEPSCSTISSVIQANSNSQSTVASSGVRGMPVLISTSPSSSPSVPAQSMNLRIQRSVGLINTKQFPLLVPYNTLYQNQETGSVNQQQTRVSIEPLHQQQALNPLTSPPLPLVIPVSENSTLLQASQAIGVKKKTRGHGLKTTSLQSNYIPRSINNNDLSSSLTCVDSQAQLKCSLKASKSKLSNVVTKKTVMPGKKGAVNKYVYPRHRKDTEANISSSTLKSLKSTKANNNCQFSYFSTMKSEASKNILNLKDVQNSTIEQGSVQSFAASPPSIIEISKKASEILTKNSPLTKTSVTVSGSSAKTTPQLLLTSSSSKISAIDTATTTKKHLSDEKLLEEQKGEISSVFSYFGTEFQTISSSCDNLEKQLGWPLNNMQPYSEEFSSENPFPTIFSDSNQEENFCVDSKKKQINSIFSVPINIEMEEDRSLSPPLGIISEVFSLKDKNCENIFSEEEMTAVVANPFDMSQLWLNANAADTSAISSKPLDKSLLPLNAKSSQLGTCTPIPIARTVGERFPNRNSASSGLSTLNVYTNCVEGNKPQNTDSGNVFLFNLNFSNLKGYENLFSPSNVFAVIKVTDSESGQLLAIRIENKDGAQIYVQATGTVLFSGAQLKDKIREVKILNFALTILTPTTIRGVPADTSSQSSSSFSFTSPILKTCLTGTQHSRPLTSTFPNFENIKLPDSINAIETPFS